MEDQAVVNSTVTVYKLNYSCTRLLSV